MIRALDVKYWFLLGGVTFFIGGLSLWILFFEKVDSRNFKADFLADIQKQEISKSSQENIMTVCQKWCQSFVEIDGRLIHFQKQGQGGPALLLIHGFGGWSYSWRDSIDFLSDYYQVYAVDLPGFGFSDNSLENNYSIEGQAIFLKSFIKEQGLRDVTLIGHSLGGAIVLELLEMMPGFYEQAILVGSMNPFEKQLGVFEDLKDASSWQVYLAASYMTSRDYIDEVIRGLYHNPDFLDYEIVDSYLAPAQRPQAVDALVKMFYDQRKISPLVWSSENQDIPISLIYGRDDRLFSPSYARGLQDYLPDSQLFFMDDVGHSPPEEKPEEFNKLLFDILQLEDR